MDKLILTETFNRGFRRGANDRAAGGLPLSGERQSPPEIPPFSSDCDTQSKQAAWAHGYATGYRLGASDTELASVDIPGAHGMISGLGQQMLETFSWFRKLSEES